MIYILDFDDFCETGVQGLRCDRIDLLFRLKSKVPKLKVNLFTILGKCSLSWIEEVKKIDWIDMIPHGWSHIAEECARWSKEDTLNYLDKIKPFNLTKGFKAPGWRISDEVYTALLEQNYWIADLSRNNARRPSDLHTYIANNGYPEKRVQGHIEKVRGDDGLEERFDFYSTLTDGNFLFIKEII